MNPGFTDSEVIRWKVYYNTFTNHGLLYYTTDGSNPGGSFGVATGTTQIVTAAYIDTFVDPQSQQLVDIVQATVPPQRPGTTVKYLVSGWKTIGTFTLPEYFADGGTCPTCAPTTNSASGTVFSYVVPVPAITGISPSSGPPGASVNITGTNFGATQATGNSTVTFNGTNAGTATAWTPTGITVNVPANA